MNLLILLSPESDILTAKQALQFLAVISGLMEIVT
jgi:hypothetical protein